MMRYKRPPEPPAFAARAAAEIARLQAAVAQGGKPKVTKGIWQDFKSAFSEAQHGRCGYCEAPVTVGQYGDVEHFAPKSEVREFVDWQAEQGREQTSAAKVRGRNPSRKWTLGYWWLAYDWKNYLLSCSVCNSVWKGNLFPVKQPPVRGMPAQSQQEIPLLLNPYGRRDPASHLRFRPDGAVEAFHRSSFGLETIRTCGLDRKALRQERCWTTARAYAAVAEVRRESRDPGWDPSTSTALKDLYWLGQISAPFPGVARTIIRQELGPLTWSQLDGLFGE